MNDSERRFADLLVSPGGIKVSDQLMKDSAVDMSAAMSEAFAAVDRVNAAYKAETGQHPFDDWQRFETWAAANGIPITD
jgi:hypothetical protein